MWSCGTFAQVIASVEWDGCKDFGTGGTLRNYGEPKNDDSLVLRMQYGKASVLLEGDAEAPSERAMLASGDRSGNAAEDGASWQPDLDYAGVFCSREPLKTRWCR